ncbi:hypothetical protein [Natrinema limicola]|uniref:hypothetical protein n=1 Tax=Natrinema limicola TaxID=370323 RepID=UPI00135F1481|nr:hypothetical protein [Natrinema limicola]
MGVDRRHILRLGGIATAGTLAGCFGTSSGQDENRSDDEQDGANGTTGGQSYD